jgi:outer membrane protein assembly factor BamB
MRAAYGPYTFDPQRDGGRVRVRRRITTLVALALLTSCATWTQVGGNPGHTGVAPVGVQRVDVARLAAVWRRPVISEFGNHIEPVSDGTTIYLVIQSPHCLDCPGDVGHVAAYDLATGARRWTAKHVEPVRYYSLAVADGVVVASGLGCTYAYDAATGAARWKRCFLAPSGSPTIANGLVYEVTQTYVFELRLSDGAPTGRTFDNEYRSNVATVGDGFLSIGARTWNLATGVQVRYDGMPGDVTISGRVLYKRTYAGDLVAAHIDSFDEYWHVTPTCAASPPTVGPDAVYVQGCGVVRAFDRATGSELWHSEPEAFGDDYDQLTLANGLLYVSNWSTELYVVDATDGSLVRDIRLGDPPGSNDGVGPPVVVRDHVIVAGEGSLEVFAPT